MNTGKIKQIIGQVVDVEFKSELPSIYDALEVKDGNRKVVLETEFHLGGGIVRAVALDSTDGLARGMQVISTGAAVSVPVGKETLGRIFNVLGEPIDNKQTVNFKSRLPI